MTSTTEGLLLYAGLAIVGFFGAWIVVGILSTRGVETPKYRVVSKKTNYEIREYEPYVIAEVSATGSYQESINSGFRAIADYIFGNNIKVRSSQLQEIISLGGEESIESQSKSFEKIAMTAPVFSEKGAETESGYKISFVMPSKYTIETLPVPRNKAIKLHEVKKHLSAVISFSGYATEKTILIKCQQLGGMLLIDKVKTISGYRVGQYNPPWTPPFMRRNEVLIDVQEEDLQ